MEFKGFGLVPENEGDMRTGKRNPGIKYFVYLCCTMFIVVRYTSLFALDGTEEL